MKGRKLLEEAKGNHPKEETAQEERLIQDKLNQRSEQLESGFNVNCNVKPNKSKIKTPISPCHQATRLKGSLCRCL